MIFSETKLKGAFVIEPERMEDERGFFARVFSPEEFRDFGLATEFVQCSISFNGKRGTLRGMHYQAEPYEEAKIVRCTMGVIFDVIVDLRPESPTFKDWLGLEMTADNRKMMYVPERFAHGFLTLEDNSEILYAISEFYHPESAQGVRWDDPAIGIQWPETPLIISTQDQSYPDQER